MRHPADRFLYIFAGALAAFVLLTSLLYAPDNSSVLRLALVVVLCSLVAGRLFGYAGVVATSLGLTLLLAVWSVWPVGGGWWCSDELFGLLVLALVSTGSGWYVASLGRHSEAARAAERDVSTAARLGVGLMPRELDAEALGRLLGSVERMSGASQVALLVAEEGPRGVATLPAEHPGPDEPSDSPMMIARLMLDSSAADGNPDQPLPSILSSRSDLYVPVASTSGLEGVLHARRVPNGAMWDEREIGIVAFAADLVGALLERDRLQAQAAHLKAMEEADALKSNILLSISHDLRTPLAAAVATVTNLIDSARAEGISGANDDLRSVAEDLGMLDWRIGELIDLARLEDESWKPNIDWNDADDLCDLVLSSIGERALNRVRCTVPSDAPPFRFDIVQLGRALHHLVENALLYSPSDEPVDIAVTYDDQQVRIAVSDRGPGLQPGEQEAVFEKFMRGSAGVTVPHGTGLGLAIASCIVAAHRGTIEVEEMQPTGARFSIVLPRQNGDDE